MSTSIYIKPSFNDDLLKSEQPQPVLIPRHPLGIKPLGNQYWTSSVAKNYAGFFQKLPQELIVVILFEILDPIPILNLGSTCKYLHVFARWDNLWKTIFLKNQKSNHSSLKWLGTWRSTYLNLVSSKVSNPRCDHVYSDILYRPFLCTHTPLEIYTNTIPRENAIAKFKSLASDKFAEFWSDKPFILTQPVQEWPIFKSWNIDSLHKQFSSVLFRTDHVKWRFDDYIAYLNNNCDESPIYLFDKNFFEKMELKKKQPRSSYWPPECFEEDFFSVLGDKRPDFRWLIIGPKRSGSTFHKDPNGTSAWNAVIRGSKYWIMFPSTAARPSPPGVFTSRDQSEVTSPLSIVEWLLSFHAEARKIPDCIEGICTEGEVLYVPSGWWHLVVNMEPTVAITQNFVSQAHLSEVLAFLRDKPDQVSGFQKDVKSPYHLFVDRMREEHSEILSKAFDDLEIKTNGKKRKWDKIIGNREEARNFTFRFCDGDHDGT